jgi:hypothetical protein
MEVNERNEAAFMGELIAVVDDWRNHNNRCFGILCSTRQFLFAITNFGEADADSVVISVQEAVKRLELAPEAEFTKVVLTPSNLLAAWHGTTFGNNILD